MQHAATKQQNSIFEADWVNQQFLKLSDRKQQKWSLNKIRKYLLDNFCEPIAVEVKISEIARDRYNKSMETGFPMRT